MTPKLHLFEVTDWQKTAVSGLARRVRSWLRREEWRVASRLLVWWCLRRHFEIAICVDSFFGHGLRWSPCDAVAYAAEVRGPCLICKKKVVSTTRSSQTIISREIKPFSTASCAAVAASLCPVNLVPACALGFQPCRAVLYKPADVHLDVWIKTSNFDVDDVEISP
jgi:hypothetical protein